MNHLTLACKAVSAFLSLCLLGWGGAPSNTGRRSIIGDPDDYESGRPNKFDSTEGSDPGAGGQYEDGAYAYPTSMMSSLDGVFIMRQSEDKLIQLPEETSHRRVYKITGYKNPKGGLFGYIGSTYADPLEVHRGTERLVLLGYEWGGRAKNDKEHIYVHDCDLLGYTAKYLMDGGRFDPTEVEDLSGATIIEYDYGRLDKAHVMVADKKGAICTYGEYSGTTFVKKTEEMLNPVYFIYQNKTTKLDIIVTRDGYCEVDISSLKPGLYVLSSYSGMFPLVVSGSGQSIPKTGTTGVQKDHTSGTTGQSSSSSSVVGGASFDSNGWGTVSGRMVRLEQTTTQTGMGWSRVVYGIQLGSSTSFDYTDGFGNSAHADLDFIAIDSTEQYGDDADRNLGSVTIDKWEPYVGQEVVVSGRLLDTGNAHTVGPVMLVDAEMNA